VVLLRSTGNLLQETNEVQDDRQGLAELGGVRRQRSILCQRPLNFQHTLGKDPHQVLERHRCPQEPFGSVLQHEGEELGERQQAGGRHGAEGVQVALLHVQRVLPQIDTALKVPRVGVDGSSVTDVIRRVWMLGAEDPLADEQRLHAHLVRVGYQPVQLFSVRDLERGRERRDDARMEQK